MPLEQHCPDNGNSDCCNYAVRVAHQTSSSAGGVGTAGDVDRCRSISRGQRRVDVGGDKCRAAATASTLRVGCDIGNVVVRVQRPRDGPRDVGLRQA